jgi:hypothetical protein
MSSKFNAKATKSPSLLNPLANMAFPYQSPTGSITGFGSALAVFVESVGYTTETANMTASAHASTYALDAIETSMLNSLSSNDTLFPQSEQISVGGCDQYYDTA